MSLEVEFIEETRLNENRNKYTFQGVTELSELTAFRPRSFGINISTVCMHRNIE